MRFIIVRYKHRESGHTASASLLIELRRELFLFHFPSLSLSPSHSRLGKTNIYNNRNYIMNHMAIDQSLSINLTCARVHFSLIAMATTCVLYRNVNV